MEKRKFIPLSMLLLTSLCLGACSCNKPSDTNVIAVVNGKKITAEEVYNFALYDSSVAEYVYGILEKALIESSISVTDSMKAVVENEIDAFVAKIKADAELNGTDYKEDLKTALSEEGVSSLEEFKTKKIYSRQKEAAKTLFLEAKKANYANKYVTTNYLYHISDINLAVSGSSSNVTDLYALTLSSAEAESIHDAILELVEGEQFYNVAYAYSSSDSKSNGGDAGIITLNDTDISNELRYALIGYSSIIEGKYQELKNNLKWTTNDYTPTLEEFYSGGLESIPLSYILGLEGNYETTECYTDDVDSVYTNSKVYYRNILFNNLLNSKSPRFITLTAEEVATYNAQDRVISATELGLDVLVPDVKNGGYKTADQSEEQYVLINEENNPYIVYKDNSGLHISAIHMTPFTTGYEKYFSDEVNDEDGTVIYAEAGNDTEARLEEVKSFAEKYITRDFGGNTADTKLLDYEIFEYYMSQSTKNGNFKIENTDVKNMINQYISSAREYADLKMEKNTATYYDEYTNLLWFRRKVVTKEVPLLSCLEEDSKGNNKCTYKYGFGFTYYSADEQGGSN